MHRPASGELQDRPPPSGHRGVRHGGDGRGPGTEPGCGEDPPAPGSAGAPDAPRRTLRESAPMIRCRDLIDFLMDYLDGELPQVQREEFESHLTICPSCVAYVKTYKEAVVLGKQVCSQADEELPED